MRKFRLWQAGLLAFIMGIPMATQARADDWGDLVEAIFDLTFSIIDLAGDS